MGHDLRDVRFSIYFELFVELVIKSWEEKETTRFEFYYRAENNYGRLVSKVFKFRKILRNVQRIRLKIVRVVKISYSFSKSI